MNKKYKCIKSYPNGPEVGSILEPLNNYYTCNNKNYYAGEWNYSEFFEEVIEKEYEILEINANVNYKLQDNGLYLAEGFGYHYSLEEVQKNTNFKIISILRKSDGEVFIIGDKLDKYKATILEFVINSYGFRVITDAKGEGLVSNEVSWRLETINKKIEPKVLFTTEDGVEITEWNTPLVWVYSDKGDTSIVYRTLELHEAHLDSTGSLSGHKHLWILFKDLGKAEEYIAKKKEEQILDKPLLSYKDVLLLMNTVGIKFYEGTDRIYKKETLEYTLKELVKSKM